MPGWPTRITENLIHQNSTMVREHGGTLGRCVWTYVTDYNGVKTIDPSIDFYLNPTTGARSRWSTNCGEVAPQNVVTNDNGVGDLMPVRDFFHWNDEQLMAKFDEYRQRYAEDLKHLVRPNTFEDLYDLFDANTLWAHGAYNLWSVVNMLVTHAHNEFPVILKEWRVFFDRVIHNHFRFVVRPQDQTQLYHNQMVLYNWDQTCDVLCLLLDTNFPISELDHMSLEQQNVFRELLILEHARLHNTTPTVPMISYLSRAANYATSSSVDNHVQTAPDRNAIQAGSSITEIEKSKPRSPLIVVGSNDAKLNAQIQDIEESAGSATADQSSTRPSPPSPPLASIPEESAIAKPCNPPIIAETDACMVVSEVKPLSPKAKPFSPQQVVADVTLLAYSAPIDAETVVPTVEDKQDEVEAPVPEIITREPTPTPDISIRDRKDSNGSTDKLFFPEASASEKLHVPRQRSIASAPDLNPAPMLPIAEQGARSISCTPFATQANPQELQLHSRHVSTISTPNGVSGQSPYQQPMGGRNQGRQQSGPMVRPLQLNSQQGSHMGALARHASMMMPPNGPPNGMIQASGAFNRGPSHMPSASNGFTPQFGPHNSHGMSMQMGPHMGPYAGSQMAPHMAASMGPAFQEQMSSHMGQQHFGHHGPQMNVSAPFTGPQNQCAPSGYQPNGYVQQPQNYGNHARQGNGYSNNGYRGNNRRGGATNNQRQPQCRDSNQSSGTRGIRASSTSSTVASQPRHNTFQGGQTCNNYYPENVRFGVHRLYNECSCHRCQSASRSIFVRVNSQLSETYTKEQILLHFADFKPEKAEMGKNAALASWFVRFYNDTDAIAAITWARGSPESSIIGNCGPAMVWYARFSKHYTFNETNPRGLPRYVLENLSHNQVAPVNANPRRDSNPFIGQRPVDILSATGINNGYGGPAPMLQQQQHNYPHQAYAGQMQPTDFVPTHGLVYQQVPAQMQQSRELFNPNTPGRRSSKSEARAAPAVKAQQHSGPKATLSKIMKVDTWRPLQAKPLSEDAIIGEDDDATETLKDDASIHSIKSAKVVLPSKEGPAREGVSHSVSPEAGDKVSGATEKAQTPAKEAPSQKAQTKQASKLKTDGNQKTQRKKEAASTADFKPSGKGGKKTVPSSKTVAVQIAGPITQSHASRPTDAEAIAENDSQSIASSNVVAPSTTKHVQNDSKQASTQNKSKTTDTDVKSNAIPKPNVAKLARLEVKQIEPTNTTAEIKKHAPNSQAVAANCTKPVQAEITTHRKKSTAKNNTDAGLKKNTVKPQPKKKEQQAKVPEAKQTGYRKVSGELAVPVEDYNMATTLNETVTGGYRKTTGQLSSATETCSYSTDTVIRRKPGRSPLPKEWADDVDDENVSTRTPSPDEGTLPQSSITNRFSRMTVVFDNAPTVADSAPVVFDNASTSFRELVIQTLSENASPSKEASTAKEAVSEDASKPVAAESAAQTQKKPKNGRNVRKVQPRGAADSHVTSRPDTPDTMQSRGATPAFDRPGSALTNVSSPTVQKKQSHRTNKKKSNANKNSGILPEMSEDKPSQAHKVALPKVALPLPDPAPSNWASVTTNAAQTAQVSKKENDDPFATGKNEAPLTDYMKTKNVQSPQKPQEADKTNASKAETSPTPSPEKKNARRTSEGKSQLNAAVQSFNPTAAASVVEPPKPKLNPAAAAFTSSPEERGGPSKKGHAKKPSLPGQPRGADKRFVTPAEQILDASKVTQPPPPSKEAKLHGPAPDRSNKNAMSARALKYVPENVKSPQKTDTASAFVEQPRLVSPKTVADIHPDAGPNAVNQDAFPTLDQAAVAGPTRKRRAASIVKAGLSDAPATAPVIGKDIKTQLSAPCKPYAQRNLTAHAQAVAKPEEPKAELAEAQTTEQTGRTDSWETVRPKQKNANGGTGRGQGCGGQGGRSVRYGKGGNRGGRGGQDTTEERKGG